MQLTCFCQEQTCEIESKHWRRHRGQTAVLNERIWMVSPLFRDKNAFDWLTKCDAVCLV